MLHVSSSAPNRSYQFSLGSYPLFLDLFPFLLVVLPALRQRLWRHQAGTDQHSVHRVQGSREGKSPSQSSNLYLDEGLGVQGGEGLLQPNALLLVLLQSQRVDVVERHVWL